MNRNRAQQNGMIGRILLALACLIALYAPTAAIVGGARNAGTGAKHIVMIVGVRGNRGLLCTGTALTRNLVLTSAHCVAPGGSYRVMTSTSSVSVPIQVIARHPRFDPQSYDRGRVTADVALIKLAAPLPEHVSPALLAAGNELVVPGDRLQIAGFGISVPGKDASTGTPHVATLMVTGRPGNLQIRLFDPATRGERLGLGACVGDSGGPAFREINGVLAVIGVVSWSTGPGDEEGCGGMTGVTPLVLYRGWVIEQAVRMGSSLP
jgi:secreted trypsin-like serine protease